MAENPYKLIINPEKVPTIFDSKIGGYPYWDYSENQYPVDSEGAKLQLLAQINLSKEKIEGLPQEGMLQFFISSTSNCYGLNFNDQTLQDSFRVVYHKSINENVEIVKNVPTSLDGNSTPVVKECSISFEKADEADSGVFVNANFTQDDPRENLDEEEAEKYKTVLFQMDSNDGSIDGEDYFMWGDMGIGAFFADSEKIRQGDFSDVLYNWDCC